MSGYGGGGWIRCTYNPATEKVVPKDAVVLAREIDGIDVARKAVEILRRSGWSHSPIGKLADQIEAQTKPPRIPEPGWGAIVEAHSLGAKGDRLRWVKGDKGWTNLDAEGQYLNWCHWDDLVDPILVREVVES